MMKFLLGSYELLWSWRQSTAQGLGALDAIRFQEMNFEDQLGVSWDNTWGTRSKMLRQKWQDWTVGVTPPLLAFVEPSFGHYYRATNKFFAKLKSHPPVPKKIV